MGMDGVEIVMEIEDHFGISIQDSEAGLIRTVEDLISLVEARIAAAHRAYCPTLSVFLALRKVTREVCGNESLRIRPRDNLVARLTSRERRALWSCLPELFGTLMNALRRPRWMRRLLLGISLALLLSAFLFAVAIDLRILPLTIAVAVCMLIGLHYLTVPFRSFPPVGLETFGEIAKRIAGTKVATKMVHLHTRDELFNEIRPLLMRVLCVDESLIVPSARLIEDLGMN